MALGLALLHLRPVKSIIACVISFLGWLSVGLVTDRLSRLLFAGAKVAKRWLWVRLEALLIVVAWLCVRRESTALPQQEQEGCSRAEARPDGRNSTTC
jgi:hypothetical protein